MSITILKKLARPLTKIKTILSTNSSYNIIATIVILLGISVRIWALLHVGDFSWDEMFSYYYPQKSWSDLLRIMIWETNPPAHLLFNKIIFTLLPANEITARLSSLIIGCLLLPLFYRISKKIFSPQISLTALIILTFHPFIVYASVLNRIYIFLVLLSIISYYFFYKIFFFKQETSKKTKYFFALTHLFLFFSHLTFVFLILSQLITLAIFNREQIKKYILINLTPGLIWLVWFIPAWWLKIFASSHLTSAWFFNINPNADITSLLSSLFFNTPTNWINIAAFFLVIIGFGQILLDQIRNKKFDQNFWIIFLPVALITTLIILTNLWNAKFFVIMLPLFALVISLTYNKILNKLVAIIFTLFLVGTSLHSWTQALPLNNFQAINNYLQTHSDENKKQIFVDNYYIDWIYLPHYYNAPQNYLIYRPTSTEWDDLIIKENYRPHLYSTADAENWITKVAANYDEIILYPSYLAGVDLKKCLDKMGWKMKDTFTIDNNITRTGLLIYEKPETIKK